MDRAQECFKKLFRYSKKYNICKLQSAVAICLMVLFFIVGCDNSTAKNLRCSSCGAAIIENANFCSSCGNSIEGSSNGNLNNNTNASCSHRWSDANCTTPKICSICGAASETAAGHSWKSASCTQPKTCAKCGETSGNPLGHLWEPATCTKPETCSDCGETSGDALGHSWEPASCTQPKTCSICGCTDGQALNHSYENGKCMTCGKTDPISSAISDLNSRIKIYGTHIYKNSADGVSVYIEWENLHNKEIKYIYFKTELYNRVNDVIACDISDEKAKWLSQTGPIPQGKGMYSSAGGVSFSSPVARPFRPDVSYSEYEEDEENGWAEQYWDCIWYNSQAYYVKIVGVEIEYMDGTTFSDTNRNVFEQLDIINLNINQHSYDYGWVYPTSAQLVAENLPYSSDNVHIESLVIDSVEGIAENEALFVCRLKGYSYEWGVELSMSVVDQFGNRVDNYISTSVIIIEDGEFVSDVFYVTTPIDGTYYLVINYDY